MTEAEQRASTAEQRATKASARAEETRRDADRHIRQLVSNAKKNADQIVAQAEAQANQLLSDTKAEAERQLSAAQRQVDELNKQKENTAAHLAQISQLLGGQLPGMRDALKPTSTVPASDAKPVTTPPKHASTSDPDASVARQFDLVMRGYNRQQVDEYLTRLVANPRLPMPDFEKVMRGYDPAQVDRYLRGLKVGGAPR